MRRKKTACDPVVSFIETPEFETQVYHECGKEWSVQRLIGLAKKLPVMEVPLAHLFIGYRYDGVNLQQLVGHMRAALDADLNYPIILSADGSVMDGRHRIMKALLEGRKTIKAVRFPETPAPCRG